jgi:hypothetical protein
MSEDPQEPSQEEKTSVAPIWAVSARIVEESRIGPGGQDTRRGTRKFNANQKVYVWDTQDGVMTNVIGRYRAKYKYINVMLHTRYLKDFRAEMIYSPTIIKYILYGYGTPETYPLTPERIARSSIPLTGRAESHQQAISIAEEMNKLADEWRAIQLMTREEKIAFHNEKHKQLKERLEGYREERKDFEEPPLQE